MRRWPEDDLRCHTLKIAIAIAAAGMNNVRPLPIPGSARTKSALDFQLVCGEFQTLSHKFLQNPSLVMLVLIVTIVAQCVI